MQYRKKLNMTTSPKIHQIIILDQSGSMASVKDVTIAGFNECVQMAKRTVEKAEETLAEGRVIVLDEDETKVETEDPNFTVSLVLFNDKVTYPFFNDSVFLLDELTADTYKPNSGTAMYDAIGGAINRMRRELGKDSTDKVLITIITDGEENSSQEFKGKEISDLLKEVQETLGWTVTFIGANIDVNKMAEELHIPTSNTLSYDSTLTGTRSALRSLSGASAMYIKSCYSGKEAKKDFFSDPSEVNKYVLEQEKDLDNS